MRLSKPRGKNRLLIFVAFLLAFALNHLHDRSIYETYGEYGVPQTTANNLQTFHRIFKNDGFLIGYSDFYAQPLWALYKIKPIQSSQHLPRPNRFSSDWRALFWVDHNDYAGSGYDRGHIVPNYAISQLYGKNAQQDSFLMSNVSPQRPNLNQKVWQRLEEAAIDRFAPIFRELWVASGPIFGSNPKRMPNYKVAIPEAFYMILLTTNPEPKMLAFIVPQNVKGTEKLEKFVASVDEVERRTGLDFFTKLPQPLQEDLESTIDTTRWQIPTQTKNRFNK